MNLDFSAVLQRQEGTSNLGVLEDTSGDQGVLQSDGTFHVRSSMVDRFGDREKTVVDLPSAGIVFGLAGFDKLEQGFRRDVSISDEEAIDVKGRVQEVLVVAREDVGIGSSLSNDGDLGVPSAHVTNTVLHGEDSRLGEDLELGGEIIVRFSYVGVLEKD